MGCESRKPFLSYSDLARILSGLASGKLPDQTQLNQILLALISFLGDVGAESDEVERPALVRCLSELLESIRLLNQARNDHDQIQDLIHQSFYHTSQSDVTISSLLDPSISSQTSDLLKHQARLIHSIFPILLSLLIDRSQSFLIILFNQSIDLIGVTISTTISSDQDGSIDGQEQPTLSDSIEQQTDRFISRLINLVVVVHQRSSQHQYRVIKGFLDKFIQSTSDLIDSSTDQPEKRSNDQQQSPIFEQLTSSLELLVRLTGQDEGADRIRSDFLEIKQFLRDQPENYLSSLREIQMILSDLLMDFDQSIYSPNLYSTLTKPIRTFLRSIRALNPLLEKLLKDLRGFVEDVLSDHLISLFLERLQAFFIQLDGFSLGSGAVGGAKGVSKVLRDDLIDYMVPRIFSLIQEIPLPRIEFISERFDVVIDPLSVRSASSFLPDSITLTSQNQFKLTSKETTTITKNSTRNVQTISINGMRLMTKNVGFYFRNKVNSSDPDDDKGLMMKIKGKIFEFEDEGMVDVYCGMANDDGLNLKIELSFNNYDCDENKEMFKILNVELKVQGFGIFPHDSNHSIINWMMKPSFEPILKKRLESTGKVYLEEKLESLNRLLGSIKRAWQGDKDEKDDNLIQKLIRVVRIGWSTEQAKSTEESNGDEEKDDKEIKLESSGITIESEDYKMYIGVGPKFLKDRGEPKTGAKFKERIENLGKKTFEEFDDGVEEICQAINQGLHNGHKDSWRSDAFNLSRK